MPPREESDSDIESTRGSSSPFLSPLRYGLLHRPRSRRSRTRFVILLLCLLLVIVIWGRLPHPNLSSQSINGYHVSMPSDLYFPWHLDASKSQDGSGQSSTDSVSEKTILQQLGTDISFHLLLPASKMDPNLCKAVYSALILNYPPPVLINYGATYDKENKNNDPNQNPQTAKIKGILNFLSHKEEVKDDDLVLIVDGFDAWFQLPAELMISRYYQLLEQHNDRWRRRYGTRVKSQSKYLMPKFVEKVVFGADKVCFPNLKVDPACDTIPSSTLPTDIYGHDTDKDALALRNRPRYLNSGTIMGPAGIIRDIYTIGARKVDVDGEGIWGDQSVIAEIFGEQEYERETTRLADKTEWLDWLSRNLGSDAPNLTTVPEERIPTPEENHEFGIGIDYESLLFQTMTFSRYDIKWLSYNDTTSLGAFQAQHGASHPRPIAFPPDLLQTKSRPFGNLGKSVNTTLSSLPQDWTWHDIPLATNVFAGTVPALLHFNGIDSKTYLSEWWDKMWYRPYARDLLRRSMMASGEHVSESDKVSQGSNSMWNARGGVGGVWTDKAVWMSYGEMCQAYEEELFKD